MSNRKEKMDMFGGGSDLEALDNEIYGGSPEIPDSGRVVARPTAIMAIHADVKQPRRAIPISIRMHWDGNPLEVPQLLGQWRAVAEQAASTAFNVAMLLKGEGEGLDTDKFPSVTQEYLSLVRLAQGIKADGLINPITVIESDSKTLIESGERRWLAYHLLHLYLGEQWAKIPAAKGNGNDSVWRQATENTQRRQLNAIGMARQIALLIMAARGTPPIENGSLYQEYDIVKGGSDRRYYAQVADGNVHRIPKGMGERIQAAMGLGMEQISQYRALLKLTDDEQVNDALWTRSDVENWSERALRDISTLTTVKVRAVIERENWTLDDLRALKEAPVDRPPMTIGGQPPQPPLPQRPAVQPPDRPIPGQWLDNYVADDTGISGRVTGVSGDWITVRQTRDGMSRSFHYSKLHFIEPPKPAPQINLEVGDKVSTRMGSIGVVQAVNGREVVVDIPQRGPMRQNIENLTLLGKASFIPQINEDEIEADVDPDAAKPTREWREGWAEDIGGSTPLGSDKADSQILPRFLVQPGSADALIYGHLKSAFDLVRDADAANLMEQCAAMTDQQIREIAPGQLGVTLNILYDQLSSGMLNLLQSWFAQKLREMEAAVN